MSTQRCASAAVAFVVLGIAFALKGENSTILSVVLIVYDEINASLRFFGKEKAKDSVLYEPVKKLAPAIFPDLIKVEKIKKSPVAHATRTVNLAAPGA